MKRIIIKNLTGVTTHRAELSDPTDWIESNVNNDSWGFKERTKWKDECTPDELLLVISEREIEIPGYEEVPVVTRTEVTLKALYTIEISDIQSEVDAENQKRTQIQNFKQAVKVILQKQDVDVTTAEVKTALLKFLRASLLKGELD